MKPNARLIAGAILALAATGAVALFAYSESADTLTETNQARCEAASAKTEEWSKPATIGNRTIAIIGDSWSIGSGLQRPREDAWPILVGQQTGTTVVVNGQGRTGYLTSSRP